MTRRKVKNVNQVYGMSKSRWRRNGRRNRAANLNRNAGIITLASSTTQEKEKSPPSRRTGSRW